MVMVIVNVMIVMIVSKLTKIYHADEVPMH